VGEFEGAHGADAVVDDGSRAQLVFAADDLRAHAEDRSGLEPRQRPDADRLGRVQELLLGVVHGDGLGRGVLRPDGDLVRVHLGEVVVEPGVVGDVALRRVAHLAGEHVDDADALAEVGEGDAPGFQDDVVLGVAPTEDELARRRADRVLDEVRRDPDRTRLAVDPAAAVAEEVEGLVGLDEDPSAVEHLEGGEMDVVHLGLREDAEAQATAARMAREQVPLHVATPRGRAAVACVPCPVQPTRSRNRATLLIGISRTSAMWNFASIAPGLSG